MQNENCTANYVANKYDIFLIQVIFAWTMRSDRSWKWRLSKGCRFLLGKIERKRMGAYVPGRES